MSSGFGCCGTAPFTGRLKENTMFIGTYVSAKGGRIEPLYAQVQLILISYYWLHLMGVGSDFLSAKNVLDGNVLLINVLRRSVFRIN